MATSCPQILVHILDPYSRDVLHTYGINYLDVKAGKIHVNSSHANAIVLAGLVFSQEVSVVGGAQYTDDMVLDPDGDPKPVVEGADLIPDPLAHLLPTVAAWDAFKAGLTPQPGSDGAGTITGGGSFPPGYYAGGISATSTSQITLQNGYYMFGGDEVTLHGSAFVTGTNVTIFLDKDVGMDVSGSGAGMLLTPPGPGDPFHGVAIFSHREPSHDVEFKINGGGPFDVSGIAYFPGYVHPYPPGPGLPDTNVLMGGTPDKTFGAILAWAIEVHGNTGYTITGDGVPPAEPPTWCDLGSGLAGSAGFPSLTGIGSLLPGSSGSLMLSSAASLAPTILFVSLSNTPTPFKGGMLSTVPSVFELGVSTDISGAWTLSWAAWPGGLPAGLEIYLQTAIADPAAVQGVSISNLLRATQP